jgi:hypothetical protein
MRRITGSYGRTPKAYIGISLSPTDIHRQTPGKRAYQYVSHSIDGYFELLRSIQKFPSKPLLREVMDLSSFEAYDETPLSQVRIMVKYPKDTRLV